MITDNHCVSKVVMVLQHVCAPLDIQRQRFDVST